MSIKKLLLAGSLLVAIGAGLLVNYNIEQSKLPKWYRDAESQAGYTKRGTSAVMVTKVGVYNAIDSTIVDGSLVMLDTTSTTASGNNNMRRFAVKPWDCSILREQRVLGIAFGDIPAKNRGGTGTVITSGYHGAALVEAGLTYGAALSPSTIRWAGVGTIPDTLNIGRGQSGMFIKYNSGTATTGEVILLGGRTRQ